MVLYNQIAHLEEVAMPKRAPKTTAVTDTVLVEDQAPEAITPVSAPEQESTRPVTPIPVKNEPPNAPPSNFGRNLWRAFMFLLKLTLFLVILGGVAVGAYFGWPIINENYLQPVQNHTSQIAALEAQQRNGDQQAIALQAKLNALQTEQAQQAETINQLATRQGNLESEIAPNTQSLDAMPEMENRQQNQRQV